MTPIRQSRPVLVNDGLGSEDRGGQGAGGGALPRVAPPVSPKAPSDDAVVAQVQSCLSTGRSRQLCQGVEEGLMVVQAALETEETAPPGTCRSQA